MDDWKRRVSLAWGMAKRLQNIWKNSITDLAFKRRIFSITIAPILTYSAFRYPLQNITCCELIHRNSNAILRYCLDDAPYPNRSHHEELYCLQMTLFMPARMLFYNLLQLGHWLRDGYLRGICHPAVQVLTSTCNFKRRSGGQRRGPSSTILHFMACTSMEDLIDLSLDRDAWRRQVYTAVEHLQLRIYSRILDRRIQAALITVVEHSVLMRNHTTLLRKYLNSRGRSIN